MQKDAKEACERALEAKVEERDRNNLKEINKKESIRESERATMTSRSRYTRTKRPASGLLRQR